eukprot:341256-Pyramimonas_sp.AAC.1
MHVCSHVTIHTAAYGKSRHRVRPALWVATGGLTLAMMMAAALMRIAMSTTTTTTAMGRRMKRKAATCSTFRIYLAQKAHAP